MAGDTPKIEAGPDAGRVEALDLVSVRQEGMTRRMDLMTFVTLIQKNAINPAAEVNSKQLTGDAWRRVSELDCYRALRGVDQVAPVAPPAPDADSADRNLDLLFESSAVSQLRADGVVAVVVSVLVAVLSTIAHRFWLFPVLMAAAWFVGYVLTDQWLFRRWLLRVKTKGFRQLPWRSRFFVLMAVVVVCYFLLSLFVPLLPGESLLRVIDGVVAAMLAGVASVVATFRASLLRAKRVFEISK